MQEHGVVIRHAQEILDRYWRSRRAIVLAHRVTTSTRKLADELARVRGRLHADERGGVGPVQVVVKEAAGCGTALILGVDRASAAIHRTPPWSAFRPVPTGWQWSAAACWPR
jgi:hypothetical protein